MFINFNTVEVLKSVGVDYFSHNIEGMTNLRDTEWKKLYNQWLSFNGSSREGADVRCDVVYIGKKLNGNKSRLRIAVYEVDNPMDTVVILQMSQVEEALAIMNNMAGYGELVCCE